MFSFRNPPLFKGEKEITVHSLTQHHHANFENMSFLNVKKKKKIQG